MPSSTVARAPIRLVAGGVRAVEEHAILDVDQPGEDQLRQHLSADLTRGVGIRVGHQSQKHAVRLDDVAALDQRLPPVQAFVERALGLERLLVGPMNFGRRRRGADVELVHAGVVARRFAKQLVPWVQTGWQIPDRLGHWQVLVT